MKTLRCHITLLGVLAALSLPGLSLAQKLPPGFTCQDLIDTSEGKLSRSTDGGRTYVPIKTPRTSDPFGAALLSHDTHLCYRLSRGEITVDQFNALHGEKFIELQGERAKAIAQRKSLENQQKAVQNQAAAIELQRKATIIQAVQAEAARQQQERQHQERMQQQQIQQQEIMQQQQIQQQQLEQIRQEQARPKTITCFGGGGFIQCN